MAIKRVFIRTSADLDSFRQEVCLMAAAEHSNVVSLLGARALPPGTRIAALNVVKGNERNDETHSEAPCWLLMFAGALQFPIHQFPFNIFFHQLAEPMSKWFSETGIANKHNLVGCMPNNYIGIVMK